MATNSLPLSVEEEGPTRLNAGHRSCRSIDEQQRERQEYRQRLERPFNEFELFTTREETLSNRQQTYRVYIKTARSASGANQIFQEIAETEWERCKGEGVPFMEPSSPNNHYRVKLQVTPSLQIQPAGIDPTKCSILTQENFKDFFTQKEIESFTEWTPCMNFELACNDEYTTITMTDFKIVITGFDENQSEVYKKTTKYALKFHSDAIKNTPSERSWQGETTSATVTERKELLHSAGVFDDLIDIIKNNESLKESLSKDLGGADNVSTLKPAELLHLVPYHDDGIETLIRCLESTGDNSNWKIAQQLRDRL